MGNDYLSFAPCFDEQDIGYDARYFSELEAAEKENFWFRSRNRLILRMFARFIPKSTNFLEIGCGTGYILESIKKDFPQTSLSGSDIHAEGLRIASKRLAMATFYQMDARHIPFSEEFDAIGAFDVIEHIEDDKSVIEQMYGALKDKGILILTVPQHKFLWSRFDDHACHVRRYSAKELRITVEKAGFKICRMTSFVTLLLPLMMLSRLRRTPEKHYDALKELKIGAFLNSLLGMTLTVERALLRLGLDMPFGGSLLVVAKKESGPR